MSCIEVLMSCAQNVYAFDCISQRDGKIQILTCNVNNFGTFCAEVVVKCVKRVFLLLYYHIRISIPIDASRNHLSSSPVKNLKIFTYVTLSQLHVVRFDLLGFEY